MKVDKIYLIGFMAAGKSTLARALADRLCWRVEDIDELIEVRERRTVAEIFAQRGEPYFRTVERDMVQLVRPLRQVVVATGGGTFVDPDNRTAINTDGLSIWVDVPFVRILTRLGPGLKRPLTADRSRLERLFNARQAAYRLAHLRLDASTANVDDLVDQVMAWLE